MHATKDITELLSRQASNVGGSREVDTFTTDGRPSKERGFTLGGLVPSLSTVVRRVGCPVSDELDPNNVDVDSVRLRRRS